MVGKCFCVTFWGDTNKLALVQKMYALIFDLDGGGIDELESLFLRFGGDLTPTSSGLAGYEAGQKVR